MDPAQVQPLLWQELLLKIHEMVPSVLAVILLAALYFQERRNSRRDQKMASLEQLYKRQAAISVEQGARIASHGNLHQLQDAAALRQLRFNDTQIAINTSQQDFSLELARAVESHSRLLSLHDAVKQEQLRLNHHQLGVNIRQSFLLARQRDQIAHASREQSDINEAQLRVNRRLEEDIAGLARTHDLNRVAFERRLKELGDAYWDLYWQTHPRERPEQEEANDCLLAR